MAVGPQCLGYLESKAGDAVEARRLFKRATAAHPTHAYSWQVHAGDTAAELCAAGQLAVQKHEPRKSPRG
jgi:hypothetical protein